MATARKLTVDNDVVGIYNCTSRCVRRAFLCGFDSYIDKDYEHRKPWTYERARVLSQIFCIETLTLSVMSNHYHIVIRNRPDLATKLTDLEVAGRWNMLHPIKKGPTLPNDRAGTIEARIKALANNKAKIKKIRAKLHNVSVFMARMNEYIARAANKEDEVTGRFWEGRFKCQKVDDIGALLAVMAYVDLNPVRAALAENLEDSDYTGIQERLKAEKAKRKLEALPKVDDPTPAQTKEILITKGQSKRADWLVPFGGQDSPFGDLGFKDYVELVEWTGKLSKLDKRGSLPGNLKSVLAQYDLDAEQWVENVHNLGGLFYRFIGKVDRLKARAKEKGMSWFCGKQGAKKLYCKPATVN